MKRREDGKYQTLFVYNQELQDRVEHQCKRMQMFKTAFIRQAIIKMLEEMESEEAKFEAMKQRVVVR